MSAALAADPVLAMPVEAPRVVRSLDLVALPTAVSLARMFVSSTLWRWDADIIELDATLIVGAIVEQVVTDSGVGEDWMRAERLERINVRLAAYERAVVLRVWDSMAEPIALPAYDPAKKPSGLEVVPALASRWGSHPVPQGRLVWADFDLYERTAAGLPRRQGGRSDHPPVSSTLEQTRHDLDLLRRLRDALEGI
jgi:hypothetical protein